MFSGAGYRSRPCPLLIYFSSSSSILFLPSLPLQDTLHPSREKDWFIYLYYNLPDRICKFIALTAMAIRMVSIILIFVFAVKMGNAMPSIIITSKLPLQHSGESVNMTISAVDSPADSNWLGIYTPPDSADDNFIGYIELSSLCDDWKTGFCSLELPLTNMRAPYQFRLFQGLPTNITKDTPMDEDKNPLPDTSISLAVSENIQFQNFNEPTQIHLALTSHDGEMRVMFITRDALQSFVKFGLDHSQLGFRVATAVVTYRKSEMCDRPANTTLGWRDPGYIHNGVMRNLQSKTQYFYQVGSDEGGWSQIFSFVSPSVVYDETNAFLFGDMGTYVPYKTFMWTQAESRNTISWIMRDLEALAGKPTFISHIGDISYARGYAWLWDEFFTRIEPIAARMPYHVCIGNHEYDWPLQPWKPEWAANVYGRDGGGECGVPYSLRFQMPGNSSLPTGTMAPATRNLYYSLTFGVVHFVYFSTETDFLPGSDQYAFLVEDLQKVDRERTPFVVLLGHRPMYTSNNETRDAPVRLQMLTHLEPLLLKYNVDLVLWGHVHKYERICPIMNFTCGEPGSFPIHVVIGMGGQDWQPAWEGRRDHPDFPIFPQPHWSLYRSEEFGYVRLHATRSNLRLSYVGNHDGLVHDSVDITSQNAKNKVDLLPPHSSRLLNSPFFGVLCLLSGGLIGITIGFLSHRVKDFRQARAGWQTVNT